MSSAEFYRRCVQVNGPRWGDMLERFSPQLIAFYKASKLYRVAKLLDVLDMGLANKVLEKYPKFKDHSLFVIVDQPSTTRRFVRPHRHFVFNASRGGWWDELNNAIASHFGAPGKRVYIVYKKRRILEPNASAVSILYSARPYEVSVRVEPTESADTYKSATSLMTHSEAQEKSPFSIELRDFELSITHINADILESDRTRAFIAAAVKSRSGKSASRKKKKTPTPPPPPPPPAPVSTVPPATLTPVPPKPASGNSRLVESIAAPLAEFSATKSSQKLARRGMPVRASIEAALDSDKLREGLLRAGIRDTGRARTAIADSIESRLAHANRNFLPRGSAPGPHSTGAAMEAYRRAFIADGGLFERIERFLDATEEDNWAAPGMPECGFCGPQDVIKAAGTYRYIDKSRFCGTSALSAYPESYARAIVSNRCCCGCDSSSYCNCRCYTPNECACTSCGLSRPLALQQQQQQTVVITNYRGRYEDDADSDEDVPIKIEDKKRKVVVMVEQQQQQQQQEVKPPPPPPQEVTFKHCGNFIGLFEKVYKFRYQQNYDRLMVIAPCDDVFGVDYVKKIEIRIAQMGLGDSEKNLTALDALLRNYIVDTSETPSVVNGVRQIRTLGGCLFEHVLKDNTLSIANTQRNCTIHKRLTWAEKFPNASFIPVHVLHSDVKRVGK